MQFIFTMMVTLIFSMAAAIEPAPAANLPCEALVCLTGAVHMQSGGTGCMGPMQAFFSIRIFDPVTGYNEAATAAARATFLNSCISPPNEWADIDVMKTYGTAFDGP
ncbi:TrbM/KikA/MpfK family conjugal transfer protein [Ralstonia psammae]|nr:TrbM/KikA/MpfK family conjugal transfer protein [Ralstonia sp. LMG 19083]